MQRSEKLQKKEKKYRQKSLKNKTSCFGYFDESCEVLKIWKEGEKNGTKRKETIPLKESLGKFYIFKSCTKKKM